MDVSHFKCQYPAYGPQRPVRAAPDFSIDGVHDPRLLNTGTRCTGRDEVIQVESDMLKIVELFTCKHAVQRSPIDILPQVVQNRRVEDVVGIRLGEDAEDLDLELTEVWCVKRVENSHD